MDMKPLMHLHEKSGVARNYRAHDAANVSTGWWPLSPWHECDYTGAACGLQKHNHGSVRRNSEHLPCV